VATTAVGLLILILYWALLAFVPVPGFGLGRLDSAGSLPTYLDRRILGISHLWPYGLTPGCGVTYDPEGILSTLPATASVLIGVLCGLWLKLRPSSSQRVVGLAAAGALLIIAGIAMQSLIPIAKKIWTDSFVLFSGGFAVLVFTMAYWLSDIRGFKTWSYPLRVFGANAILAFVLSQVIGAYSDPPFGLRAAGFAAFHAVIRDAKAASLVYAVANSVGIFAVLSSLYNRRIFLRV
jgi:predicted acyltransferase